MCVFLFLSCSLDLLSFPYIFEVFVVFFLVGVLTLVFLVVVLVVLVVLSFFSVVAGLSHRFARCV